MTKFCPDCGAAIIDNSKFCKNCGRDVSNLQPQAPQQTFVAQNQAMPPVVEKDNTALIIIGIIVSIIIPLLGPIAGMAIGAYILSKKDNPKNETYGLVVLSVGLIFFVLEVLFVWLVLTW